MFIRSRRFSDWLVTFAAPVRWTELVKSLAFAEEIQICEKTLPWNRRYPYFQFASVLENQQSNYTDFDSVFCTVSYSCYS